MTAPKSIVLLIALLLCTVAQATERPGVVLLPIDNISGAADAPALVRAALVARLERAGWRVIEGDAVEPILEQNRVRYLDSLTDVVRGELSESTGAAAFLLASVTTFRGGDAAIVSLSGRLIAADGSLLWSNLGGAHADQTETMLGGARHKGPEDVARDAVESLARDLPRPGAIARVKLSSGGTFLGRSPVTFVARELVADRKARICILPFDGNSQVPGAAFVVANAFAVRLAATGAFDVVEPAELRAASVKAGIGSFISLGSQELARLGKIVGTPLFLRGTIVKYADTDGLPPEVEIDLFLVDVEAGSVLWSASHARNGADYTGLLMLGAVVDGASLADRIVCELAVSEQKSARKNTSLSAAHSRPTRPQRRELLATAARKDD
jgi:hypothetical protein